MEKRRGRYKTLGILVLVALVCVPLYFFSSQIKNFFYAVSSPFQKSFCTAGSDSSGFFSSLFSGNKLQKEIANLKNQNAILSSNVLDINALKKENEVLRHAIGVELNKDYKLEMTNITAKDVSNDYITIDKGTENGVKEGMAVITNEKAVVGRTIEVQKNYAKVILISNKKSSFDAEIEEKGATGVLRGSGRLSVLLDLIPREKNITEGDMVKTSNITGVFPPNLLVGWIKKVMKNDVESIQQAELELGFDIKNTNSLFIILNK
jgi:rod shape-determining protein MreC